MRQDDIVCAWPECPIHLTYRGKGRPPKYCSEHAKDAKKAKDRSRPNGGHIPVWQSRCCRDAQLAGVATNGTIKITVPWHDALKFGYDIPQPKDGKTTLVDLVIKVTGARVVKSQVHVCEQHKQVKSIHRHTELTDPRIPELIAQGSHLTSDRPDKDAIPESRLGSVNGIKFGKDTELDHLADAYTASAN